MAKLTTLEKRAQDFAAQVRHHGSSQLTVTWMRSREWGLNARVDGCGIFGKMAYASGSGYCKESAALADALRFLGADEEQQRLIWRTSACGVEAVRAALAKVGYELDAQYIGRLEHVYQVRSCL